jgi:hypothetical protein
MKLKDIVPYCLGYAKKLGNGIYEPKYYWVIQGLTYSIDSLQSYNPDHMYGDIFNPKLHLGSVNFINLSRYCFTNSNETQNEYDPNDNYLTLNLDNEITIFNNFIMVHKTSNETTDSEKDLFFKTNYHIANDHNFSSSLYNIALFHTDPILGGIATNLRTVFKDLIVPPVQSKPAKLTLDEKVDNLIDDLIKENKVKAIKKLKRMLNERL